MIQFPIRKGWKRIHRLVVLPDYQGLGIGVKFINAVSELVVNNGMNVNLTTTTPALVNALKKSNKWHLMRKGQSKTGFGSLKNTKDLTNKASNKRPTFSFNYNK